MIRAHEAFSDLLQQVDALLPRTPDGSPDREREYADVVQDLLAFLARRMTELHEARLAEVRSFLTWLEERLECPVDDLAGKSFVLEYYDQGGGVEKLLTVLRKNRARIGVDVSPPKRYMATNEARATIIDGYERSMATLRPILTQVELTERLIDLVVYRLYGLAEEEMALVDEATGYAVGVG